MNPDEFTAKREALGFSRKELATAFDVTYTAVYYWETGQRKIPPLVELAFVGLELKLESSPIGGEGEG